MYKHILVAVGTRADSITLEAAIRLARQTGARITALHVVDPVPPYAGVDTYDFSVTLEAFDAYGRAVAERCVAAIHQAGCEGDARTIVLPMCGSTMGRAIAEQAREMGADLLVIGNRKQTLWSLFRENLYKELLRYTDAPVLVATDALPAASGLALALRPRYAQTIDA
ncbi:universal stress protein [Paraburkholderia rhizosphaerae]|uniref:Nucleotide-binding universal stress UspA family protein n=1 Tax=Paraburkholderia rhizosphaerae TaxID=480658 RepID=A0A4R8LMH5_9BURK|nr:universal stress protein [Paraburkholderia rhizosphaerae]TDY46527.1 nucleotide-binding universal stress UspA family protein [Paraburkholderia rhizosphaerae]